MVACIFDGTIESFFTAVFDFYKGNITPDVFCCKEPLQTVFDMQIIRVTSQKEKAERIRCCILKNVKVEGYRHLLYAYRSCKENKYKIIYDYLTVIFKYGKDAPFMLSDKRVISFFDISRAVALECHRMQGFIHFKECGGGIFYADYAPDNDITEFIMPHFCKRFNSMPFVIHDVKRNIAGIYNKKEHKIFYNLDVFNICQSENEQRFLKIWKMYYNTVSIKQRKNTRLMKRFMPVRYWKFMPEKQDNNDF
ncbi:MAG: TIGR03915 family putative DNA repair protein [Clostridia bacterium]|nr:TIGR03915 family putative DNA repair protein [Clostridia bacterium]